MASSGSSAPNPRVPAAAAAGGTGTGRAFVCRFCGQVWGSARSLANHTVMHTHTRSPRSLGDFLAPPVLDPVGPPVMPPGLGFFVQPPAMAPAQPVLPQLPFGHQLLQPAPPLRFFGPGPVLPQFPFGRLLPPAQPLRFIGPRPVLPPAAAGAGNAVAMAPLDPNPAFWASHRNPGSSGPVEHDLLGLLERPAKPVSPSPSFSDWLPREDGGSSVEME